MSTAHKQLVREYVDALNRGDLPRLRGRPALAEMIGAIPKPLRLGAWLLCAAGCASTHIALKDNASFAKYTRIYLQDFKEDPRHVVAKAKDRLERLGYEVLLTEKDEPVGGSRGTGFVVSADGFVVTSAHVIKKKKDATVWVDGKRYEADVVRVGEDPTDDDGAAASRKPKPIAEALNASVNSKENRSIDELLSVADFAVLKIRSPDPSFVPASFAVDPQYRMGQEVYTIGYPLSHILGDSPRLNKGLVSSPVGIHDNPHFIQMSAEIQPGNSGGPLLNDQGQVIGVVQMTLDPKVVYSQTGVNPQNVNFAVKSARLRDFLAAGDAAARPRLREGEAVPFDQAQHAVVQVYAGLLPPDFKEQPKLACAISYSDFWDLFYRFQMLDVVFYDVDTQEVLLRAGQYGDNALQTEDRTLDAVFRQIAAKLGK